jgi:triacylglycerol lipase
MTKPLPPMTIDALRPPPGPAFPYSFFENVADHPFDPTKRDFDLRNAWWLSDAAFLAYSANADVEATFARPPLTADLRCFAGHHGTSCYVATATDWIVLAFRGTEVDNFWGTAFDVVTDARVVPARDEHGDFVHGGFLQGVNEVWQDVRQYIAAQQEKKVRPLWITGHSLGAGLATIAANRCMTDPALHAAGLYAYASPPVGDRRFAERITLPAFRFANNTDALTHVPYGPFTPVGRLVFIDRNGQLHGEMPSAPAELIGVAEQFGIGALSAASRFFRTLEPAGVLPPPIADHAPIYYSLRLWNAYVGASLF